MKVVTFLLELEEPLLATTLAGDPNSETTSDYIPGSLLRGALIARHIAAAGGAPAGTDAADARFRRLFLDGSTRYLNGYPLICDERTLPVPHSWQQRKGEKSEVTDFAVEPGDENHQWKPVSAPFCTMPGDSDAETAQATTIRPAHTIAVHTNRDRRYGRPRSGSGAVFRYESLEAGQTFKAAILCDEESDADWLRQLLEGSFRLGGSRSGGYGRVRVSKVLVLQGDDWRETTAERDESGDRRLTVSLLSDVILRDDLGQHVVTAEAVAATVSRQLGGIRLRPLPKYTFFHETLIGGFNRKWGLPLIQTPAMQMGSVLVFEVDSDPEVENIRRLERRGIGERRAEGFGRIAINLERHEELEVTQWEPDKSREERFEITDPASREIARRMAERMLRRRLDVMIAKKANVLGALVKHPSKSQISRLRLAIRDALAKESEKGRKDLLEYVDHLKGRSATQRQFNRDIVATKPLIDWLKSTVEETQGKEFSDIKKKLPGIGRNIEATLTPKLIFEYNLRLIDGVLMRAAKKRKEG